MQRKKQFISELKRDDTVDDLFAIKFKKPVEAYAKGFRFELRVADKTKAITVKYWGNANEAFVKALYDSLQKDDVVRVQGRVSEWNNMLEISSNEHCTIEKINPKEYDSTDFIKVSEKDPEQMWKELFTYIDRIENKDIKELVEYFFKDEKFAEKFKYTPAAMYIHHGWIHGLLEHTLSLLMISDGVLKVHTSLNKDLVIAGLLFHDMGKIREYETTTSINITTEGTLIGHVTIALDMLEQAMNELNSPEEVRIKVKHIVLTHMGEYGSSKKPSFPEALAVYFIDNLDANLMHMILVKDEANTEEETIYNKDFGNVYLR